MKINICLININNQLFVCDESQGLSDLSDKLDLLKVSNKNSISKFYDYPKSSPASRPHV